MKAARSQTDANLIERCYFPMPRADEQREELQSFDVVRYRIGIALQGSCWLWDHKHVLWACLLPRLPAWPER